jgi:hypothetical protein
MVLLNILIIITFAACALSLVVLQVMFLCALKYAYDAVREWFRGDWQSIRDEIQRL